MNFKKTIAAGVAALGLAAAGSASAQGGYGSLSAFDWEVQQGGSDENALSSTGVRAVGGAMLSDYVGLEFHAASGGSDNLHYPIDDTTTQEAEVELNKVLGLFARANLPVTDYINVFGLFGYSHGKLEVLAQTTTDTISESGFGWGAGAEVALVPNRLYLAFDHIAYLSQNDIDASATSIGLRLSFSGQ